MSGKPFVLLSLLLLVSLLTNCGTTPVQTAEPTTVPITAPAVGPTPGATPGSADTAGLTITGKVANAVAWTEEEVRAMSTVDVQSTNSQGGTEAYTGVPISKLLEMAGPAADATTLVFIAAGGSTAEVALADVLACADCIVSFRSKGGFSTVLPGFSGKAQVKGVIEIQVK